MGIDYDKVERFLIALAEKYQEYQGEGYSGVAASVAAMNEAQEMIPLNDQEQQEVKRRL